MSLIAGAEPFRHDGGRVGVLLCHGFTGSPASLRPWAHHLADAGLSVRLPRLPGHGTRWQDLQRTTWPDWFGCVEEAFDDLLARCDHVFVMGLSMGATLALRLAEVRGEQVRGVVVVNPSLMSSRTSLRFLPLLEHVIPSAKGIGNDVAKPGVAEGGYGRVPLRAMRSLTRLWATTRDDLPRVTQPLLIFRSAVDHVVEPANAELLRARVRSTDIAEMVLQRSFHVATLDHDADQIIAGSLRFVARLVPTGSHESARAVQD